MDPCESLMKPEALLPQNMSIRQVQEVRGPTEALSNEHRYREEGICFPPWWIGHMTGGGGHFFMFLMAVFSFISMPDYTHIWSTTWTIVLYQGFNYRCIIDVILTGGLKRFDSVITVGITMLSFPQKAPFSGATDSHLKMEGQKGITGKLQNHRLLYLLFSK